MKFAYQRDVWAINCFTDADWAGDAGTRKSTSASSVCMGDHMCSSWSKTQTVIALSSGESEFYALSLCAARGLGFQSLLVDLGVHLKLRILTDATTGMAIASRRGLGKLRHISTHELWIQEHISRGSIQLGKIKNIFNPADIGTKYLDKRTMDDIMHNAGHEIMGGRSSHRARYSAHAPAFQSRKRPGASA